MADETPTSKKLLEKQQRRAAEEQRRREQQKAARKRNLATLVIAVVVLAAVVTLVVQDRDGGGGGSLAGSVGEREAGCDPIEEHEDEGQDHVETTPQYGTNPPTSGPHLATPASSGFFEDRVEPGALVHNLEHGQIVFWYDPDAPQTVIDALEAVVDEQPQALIAVPWDDVESPKTFVMTAWTRSQACRQVSTEVVNEFRAEFQGKGPEPVGIPTYEPED